jgi:curli biogenesis system outer membrane secretion channel CsgG
MIRRILLWAVWASMLCGSLSAAAEATAIAIWPFDNNVIGNEAPADEQLLVQEVFPDLLGSELSTSPRFRLVERQRLGDVLNEQKLGASELADDATRLRLGRLVGARWMAFGSYLRIGDSWQIDVRIVDAETSQIIATSSEAGQKTEYGAVFRRIAAQVIKNLP